MGQRSLLYYDISLYCTSCGYITNTRVGPVFLSSEVSKPLERKVMLYCAPGKEIVSASHRLAGDKKSGDNQCVACGENFINLTLFSSPLENIKHCWGNNHLELDYSSILNEELANVGIPCPKCFKKGFVKQKAEKVIELTEVFDEIDGEE